MHRNIHISNKTGIATMVSILLLASSGGCGLGGKDSRSENVPDTLHAVTIYGPTTYFNYRGQEMGYEFENLRQFAEDENMVLDLKVAPTLQSLLKMLQEGDADLAAHPVPRIEGYADKVVFCGPREVTWQVLVQPAGKEKVTDVTQLVGKSIYVEKDSKYHYRLQNLNHELGGGIDIVAVSKDSLIAEDMIEMVDNGEIAMTVVDSDIAEINKSYYPGLDIGMKVSLDQYASWAVAHGRDSLAAKLNRWESRHGSAPLRKSIFRKYYEISKTAPLSSLLITELEKHISGNSKISDFDDSFKRHSSVSGYDWMVLAAIAYNESRFDNNVVSWAGARGVMQLMPSTAKAMGVDSSFVGVADYNILAAAKLVSHLDKSLASKVPDKHERLKFVLAAYNSGLGHIFDAIALAGKYGLDSTLWLGNVSETVLMKSRPQYYNDPVVKNGYFRGKETVEFVDNVMTTYSIFRKHQ